MQKFNQIWYVCDIEDAVVGLMEMEVGIYIASVTFHEDGDVSFYVDRWYRETLPETGDEFWAMADRNRNGGWSTRGSRAEVVEELIPGNKEKFDVLSSIYNTIEQDWWRDPISNITEYVRKISKGVVV